MSGDVSSKQLSIKAARQTEGRSTERPRSAAAPDPYACILAWQDAGGNQSVSRLLRPGTEASGVIQTKLRLGQPGDRYEQEANRFAQHAIDSQRMSHSSLPFSPQPTVRRQSDAHGAEQNAQVREDAEGASSVVSQAALSSSASVVHPQLANQVRALQGRGQRLGGQTQTLLEQRFGRDLSQARVHTGTAASSIARSLNARAFTVGHEIFFASDAYQPNTNQGLRLLAHEITHTLQQRGDCQLIQRQGTSGLEEQRSATSSFEPEVHIGSRLTPVHLLNVERQGTRYLLTFNQALSESEARDYIWPGVEEAEADIRALVPVPGNPLDEEGRFSRYHLIPSGGPWARMRTSLRRAVWAVMPTTEESFPPFVPVEERADIESTIEAAGAAPAVGSWNDNDGRSVIWWARRHGSRTQMEFFVLATEDREWYIRTYGEDRGRRIYDAYTQFNRDIRTLVLNNRVSIREARAYLREHYGSMLLQLVNAYVTAFAAFAAGQGSLSGMRNPPTLPRRRMADLEAPAVTEPGPRTEQTQPSVPSDSGRGRGSTIVRSPPPAPRGPRSGRTLAGVPRVRRLSPRAGDTMHGYAGHTQDLGIPHGGSLQPMSRQQRGAIHRGQPMMTTHDYSGRSPDGRAMYRWEWSVHGGQGRPPPYGFIVRNAEGGVHRVVGYWPYGGIGQRSSRSIPSLRSTTPRFSTSVQDPGVRSVTVTAQEDIPTPEHPRGFSFQPLTRSQRDEMIDEARATGRNYSMTSGIVPEGMDQYRFYWEEAGGRGRPPPFGFAVYDQEGNLLHVYGYYPPRTGRR